MKQNKMPPPTNWYPREGPKVVCNNMKPFVYSPLPGIPYNNSGSGNVEMNRNQMEGVQPYFQN